MVSRWRTTASTRVRAYAAAPSSAPVSTAGARGRRGGGALPEVGLEDGRQRQPTCGAPRRVALARRIRRHASVADAVDEDGDLAEFEPELTLDRSAMHRRTREARTSGRHARPRGRTADHRGGRDGAASHARRRPATARAGLAAAWIARHRRRRHAHAASPAAAACRATARPPACARRSPPAHPPPVRPLPGAAAMRSGMRARAADAAPLHGEADHAPPARGRG